MTTFLREPHIPLDHAFATCQQQPVEAVEQMIRLRRETDEAVRKHLQHAADYAARYTSSKRRHLEFSVGDLVLLSTAHLPLPAPLSRKLAAKWLGPLPVVGRVGAVAYRV